MCDWPCHLRFNVLSHLLVFRCDSFSASELVSLWLLGSRGWLHMRIIWHLFHDRFGDVMFGTFTNTLVPWCWNVCFCSQWFILNTFKLNEPGKGSQETGKSSEEYLGLSCHGYKIFKPECLSLISKLLCLRSHVFLFALFNHFYFFFYQFLPIVLHCWRFKHFINKTVSDKEKYCPLLWILDVKSILYVIDTALIGSICL